ncbi:MAG: glycerophosphodiester phosphodiesterase family protein [Filomicrobium sp.]
MASGALDQSLLPRAFLQPMAHRGLHDAAAFENTMPAFVAAIAAGFGIECDVRAAKNGLPVVFHDASVPDGLPFAGRSVSTLADSEVENFCYADQTPLLTFDAFLDLVGGRVPILAELKFDGRPADASFLAALTEAASRYVGPLAFMSFEPSPIGDLARLAPDIPRGLVVQRFDELPGAVERLGKDEAQRRARASDFAAVGASFVAYELGGLARTPPEELKLPPSACVFAWTVQSAADLVQAESLSAIPICEGEATRLLQTRQSRP